MPSSALCQYWTGLMLALNTLPRSLSAADSDVAVAPRTFSSELAVLLLCPVSSDLKSKLAGQDSQLSLLAVSA